jgi:hypothetical protein
MTKHMLLLLVVISAPFLSSCGQEEAERKAVPPTSSAGSMPWNRPMPGEGSGQFGGMLQRR